MAPMWVVAARAPASLLPALSTMIGLMRETARAALMNLRVLVRFSM